MSQRDNAENQMYLDAEATRRLRKVFGAGTDVVIKLIEESKVAEKMGEDAAQIIKMIAEGKHPLVR